MTDKEQKICKYKFQDKEKFDGKPYCTCFNELCKNLSFVCDQNCIIYEDYKQLARKTQLSIKQSKELIRLRQELKESTVKNKNLRQECERLKWYLKEIRYDELKALDIEWDEYETHCIDSEYSNIINLVEEALKERSSEDCRYDR